MKTSQTMHPISMEEYVCNLLFELLHNKRKILSISIYIQWLLTWLKIWPFLWGSLSLSPLILDLYQSEYIRNRHPWMDKWMNEQPVSNLKTESENSYNTSYNYYRFIGVCAQGAWKEIDRFAYAKFLWNEKLFGYYLLLFLITSHHYVVDTVCIIIT